MFRRFWSVSSVWLFCLSVTAISRRLPIGRKVFSGGSSGLPFSLCVIMPDPTQILFDAISGLTGGIIKDVQTAMIAILLIVFLLLGFDLLKDVLFNRYQSRAAQNKYWREAEYHLQESSNYQRGTIEYDYHKARYRKLLNKISWYAPGYKKCINRIGYYLLRLRCWPCVVRLHRRCCYLCYSLSNKQSKVHLKWKTLNSCNNWHK